MAIKPTTENFVTAQNAAVVLNPTEAGELTVRGLQGMGLCLGFSMKTQEVAEVGRRIALTVPAGGAYQETNVNYNFIPGDVSLNTLRNAALNATKLTAIRLYIKNGCDFSAPDLISDPSSGLYVGSMTDPKADNPNGVFTGSMSYMPAGPFVLFVAHKTGIQLTYTAATKTIASAGSDFITLGFEAGDTLIFDGITGKVPLFLKASTVAAGSIVIATGVGDQAQLTVDVSANAAHKLHGATPLAVSAIAGC